jgi:hypothetical protein
MMQIGDCVVREQNLHFSKTLEVCVYQFVLANQYLKEKIKDAPFGDISLFISQLAAISVLSCYVIDLSIMMHCYDFSTSESQDTWSPAYEVSHVKISCLPATQF